MIYMLGRNRGMPFTFNYRRERHKKTNARLVSSEGEDTSVLQFLPFNFSVTSGGVSH